MTGCEGEACGGGWVETPFEDVALDDEGSGDGAFRGALGFGADVDQDGLFLCRGVGFVGGQADESGAGCGQELVDRRGGGMACGFRTRLLLERGGTVRWVFGGDELGAVEFVLVHFGERG